MKDNGPITNKEIILEPDTIIVSNSDLVGNIKSWNDDFQKYSGYLASEIENQPHNILRHPDVPSAVFKDFWDTLKQGKPWTQIVKNRAKNGDHYWVEANVTPVKENGQITGYISIRYPATESQKRAAEQAYRDIASGKVTLKGGKLRTLKDKINIFKQFDAIYAIPFLTLLLVLLDPIGSFLGLDDYTLPAIAFLGVVILLFSAVQTGRLKQLQKQVESVAEGHFRNVIDTQGNTVTDRIAQALQSIQVRVGNDLQETKTQLVKSARIESGLYSASGNLMIADQFNVITFVNKSLKDMLQDIEPELQKVLPNFCVETLIGTKIDVFHQKPEHQTQLLKNLTETFKTRIEIAGLILQLDIAPVFNYAKERIGTVVEWTNMTSQVNIEKEVAHVIAEAGKGNLSSRLDTSDLTGFLKEVGERTNELLDTFAMLVLRVSTVLDDLGKGDLTNQCDAMGEGEVRSMQDALNNAIASVVEALSAINLASSEVFNSSNEVSSASSDLSDRTQQQAASLEETASAMEEIMSITRNTVANTEQASQLAQETMTQSTVATDVMGKTETAMQSIEEVSNKIADITSLIDSIAFQTNLLALNAAVEAARAGEHGRGFAVVAGEVRNLAQRSADASKEIGDLVASSTKEIQQGSTYVAETAIAIGTMVSSTEKVGNIIQEVAHAAHEQEQGVEQINTAISAIDSGTQQNAALVEELSASAVNMSDKSKTQMEYIERFKLPTKSH